MRLSAKQDVEAPLAQVWTAITDFNGWERAAMRRGADVARTDSQRRGTGLGASWTARFSYRGRERRLRITLLRIEGPHHLDLQFQSNALEGEVLIELIEMSARRTRMHVVTEMKPQTLGARLFLQSLRLTRARVERRYHDRIAAFSREIELRAGHQP